MSLHADSVKRKRGADLDKGIDWNSIAKSLQRIDDSSIFAQVYRYLHLATASLQDLLACCEPAHERLFDAHSGAIAAALCEEVCTGSCSFAAAQDPHCLQTMTAHVFFGLLLAESKFRSERGWATALIQAHDYQGLKAFVANPERQHLSAGLHACTQEFLVPFAEDIQVEYLLVRLAKEPSAKRRRLCGGA